jgi:hypothetical protein
MYKFSCMDLSSHRQHVARALGALETSIERLLDALAHRPVWITVDGAATEAIAIQRACAAYAAINYGMQDAVETSVVCLGLIGASSDILRSARAVNAAKIALKEICVPLQQVRIRVPVKGQAEPTKAIPAIRVILRNIQRSDLNLLAAYRKIPLLDAPPASVTYTRANTRAVHRKSIDDLHQLLANLGGPTAAADRARLLTLRRGESHLALVRDRYQNIRANVLYARLDPRGRGRIQISAELPLMYVMGRRAAHPEVHFPTTTDDEISGQPQRVRQSKLEAHPFLQSLPIYRYSIASKSITRP